MVSQLGGGRRHNYSTRTRQAGHANEQYMYFSYVYGLDKRSSLFSDVSDEEKKVLTPDGWSVGEQDEHGGHEQEDGDDGAGSNPAHLVIMKKIRILIVIGAPEK